MRDWLACMHARNLVLGTGAVQSLLLLLPSLGCAELYGFVRWSLGVTYVKRRKLLTSKCSAVSTGPAQFYLSIMCNIDQDAPHDSEPFEQNDLGGFHIEDGGSSNAIEPPFQDRSLHLNILLSSGPNDDYQSPLMSSDHTLRTTSLEQ